VPVWASLAAVHRDSLIVFGHFGQFFGGHIGAINKELTEPRSKIGYFGSFLCNKWILKAIITA
jgi:hypothetical protein